MKIIFYLIILFVSQYTFAQDLVFSFSKKEYLSTIIKLENGKEVQGFVKDFTLPNTVEFRGYAFDFKSVESQLKLDRKKFKFKKTLDSNMEFMGTDSIQSITLIEKDSLMFEKIKLKTVNSKLEIVDLNIEIMAPIIRKDKINLYAYKVYNCNIGCELMFLIAYIKNTKEKYAIIPIDMDRMSIFDMSNIVERYFRAFEEVGKDCPKFIEYLENQKKIFKDDKSKKELEEIRKKSEIELKEKLKLVKDRKEKNKIIESVKTEEFLFLFHKLIDEYVKLCE